MDAQSLPRTADAVVIGGGITGCATALALARRGLHPVVLEKSAIGAEQSSRNWGFVRQQGRDEAEIPLMVDANAVWAALEEESGRDIGWRQRGNLQLVRTADALPRYEDWVRRGRAHGVPARMLQPSEIKELLPGAQGRWVGAMYTPNDGQAEPTLATLAIRDLACRAGAFFHTGVTVTSVLVRKGRVVGVTTPSQMIATPVVIVAAGVWTRRILTPLGVDLPLQWVRSTVAETAPVEGLPDIPAVWDANVAFRKTTGGGVVFAASGKTDIDAMVSAINNLGSFTPLLVRNLKTFGVHVGSPAVRDLTTHLGRRHRFDGWEPPVNRRNVRRSYVALTSIYPQVAEAPVVRTWAGYIDGTPDNLPVLSTVPRITGLVVGAGFSGHGFGLAPASGHLLAELAVDGTSARHDVKAFALDRFADPTYRPSITIVH